MIVIGWAPSNPNSQNSDSSGPFDYLLRSTSGVTDTVAANAASQVIRSVFKDSATDVALFMDQRTLTTDSYGHKHIFMPFFGGSDDRTALQLVVQLCLNPRLSATVVRVVNGPADNKLSTVRTNDSDPEKSPVDEFPSSGFTIQAVRVPIEMLGSSLTELQLPAYPDTVYGHQNTAHQLQSSLADDMLWQSSTAPPAGSPHLPSLRRIKFVSVQSTSLLRTALDNAKATIPQIEASHGRLLVVIGRNRTMQGPADTLKGELTAHLEQTGQTGLNVELRRTIGDPATGFISSRIKADLLVMQTSKSFSVDEV